MQFYDIVIENNDKYLYNNYHMMVTSLGICNLFNSHLIFMIILWVDTIITYIFHIKKLRHRS